MRKFKQVTITLHEDTIKQFKEFCSVNKLPISRFLGYAGLRFIKQQVASLSEKAQAVQGTSDFNRPMALAEEKRSDLDAP